MVAARRLLARARVVACVSARPLARPHGSRRAGRRHRTRRLAGDHRTLARVPFHPAVPRGRVRACQRPAIPEARHEQSRQSGGLHPVVVGSMRKGRGHLAGTDRRGTSALLSAPARVGPGDARSAALCVVHQPREGRQPRQVRGTREHGALRVPDRHPAAPGPALEPGQPAGGLHEVLRRAAERRAGRLHLQPLPHGRTALPRHGNPGARRPGHARDNGHEAGPVPDGDDVRAACDVPQPGEVQPVRARRHRSDGAGEP